MKVSVVIHMTCYSIILPKSGAQWVYMQFQGVVKNRLLGVSEENDVSCQPVRAAINVPSAKLQIKDSIITATYPVSE